MRRLDLDAIKTRCEAATPGPWTTPAPGPYIFEVEAEDDDGPFNVAKWCSPTDARFIAHARTDVPALVAEVEMWRARDAEPWVNWRDGAMRRQFKRRAERRWLRANAGSL